MDGLEATRRIRLTEKEFLQKEGRRLHQLILGVTAATDEETFEEGIKVGIDDFMPKPFPPATFNLAVAENMAKLGINPNPPPPVVSPSPPPIGLSPALKGSIEFT
jgi:CheY-like chemotaxis protein